MNEHIQVTKQFDTMREDSFMKKLLKNRLNQKGLTLIELLAVIVILAIVAAIAVPAIGNIINNSRDKAILAEASNIIEGAKLANLESKCGAPDADGDVDCTGTELTGYISGITLPATSIATMDGTTKEWTVTYAKFSELNGSAYTAIKTAGSASETTINGLLD